MFRLLALWVEGLKICTERGYADWGQVLRPIKRVRAYVGHATRRATCLGLDAPIPVRVVEQPVLRIRALDNEDFTQVSGFAHGAHLLHHGVITQIVADAVVQTVLRG